MVIARGAPAGRIISCRIVIAKNEGKAVAIRFVGPGEFVVVGEVDDGKEVGVEDGEALTSVGENFIVRIAGEAFEPAGNEGLKTGIAEEEGVGVSDDQGSFPGGEGEGGRKGEAHPVNDGNSGQVDGGSGGIGELQEFEVIVIGVTRRDFGSCGSSSMCRVLLGSCSQGTLAGGTQPHRTCLEGGEW